MKTISQDGSHVLYAFAFKKAEKLKSCEMKEGLIKMMKDEG